MLTYKKTDEKCLHVVQLHAGVAPADEKLRSNSLTLFGHVFHGDEQDVVKKVLSMGVVDMRVEDDHRKNRWSA